MRIRTNERAVFNNGFEFVHTVIIAGNGACADIDLSTDIGIAQITQVVGLAALAESGFFELNKIADVRICGQLGARTQSRVGADLDVFGSSGLLQMAECLNLSAGAQRHIAQNAVRPHAHAVGQCDIAFKHAADINKHIAPAFERTAQIKAGRVGQGDALDQQALCLFSLPGAFQLCLLYAAVDAQRFPVGIGLGGIDGHVVLDRQRNGIGQIIFALRIIVVDATQPVFQLCGGGRQNARVDLTDFMLLLGCILVLDNPLHLATFVANDAAIPGRVLQRFGQHGHAIGARLQQAL